ncbi:tocopherol cyclase [Aureococcus anophagefferens]|uniref:Tocopherol cyclase n=1 Tax=Aureococcus anophagefferens TaxID=44056 RepID=A0ABR1FN00_AURAN
MRRTLATLALLRMAAPLAPSRTPHSGYHGQGSSTPFFEGWYNRLTLPEAETSVALIFAVFDPGAAHAAVRRWGGAFANASARQYSTAGWLASLGPLFSPHYQVLMSLGRATGFVEVDGERLSFARAPFYAEKNWGAAFPSRWWWLQCNAFEASLEGCSELTLTATGATRQLLAGTRLDRSEDVALIGLHVDGEFLPFPDVRWTVAPWGDWRVSGAYEGLTVDIAATASDAGVPVRVPTDAGMADGATETYDGRLSVELRRGGDVLVAASTHLACCETGGDYASGVWGPAASEMAEPLRTVAFNLDLERAVSAGLDAAQRRGWLEIPGL